MTVEELAQAIRVIKEVFAAEGYAVDDDRLCREAIVTVKSSMWR